MRVLDASSIVRVLDASSIVRVLDASSIVRVLDASSIVRVLDASSIVRVLDASSIVRVLHMKKLISRNLLGYSLEQQRDPGQPNADSGTEHKLLNDQQDSMNCYHAQRRASKSAVNIKMFTFFAVSADVRD